jgi:predicted nucleotidyltransferase
MLTKTQTKIMKYFVAQINEQFTINGIAKLLNMNVSLVHRSIKPLIQDLNLLNIYKKNFISLNYNENHGELAHIEYLRMKDFLLKNKNIDIFRNEILEKLDQEYFIMILFGSAIKKSNPNDYDVLFIFENFDKVKRREKAIEVIASNFEEEFDINVVSVDSIYEMATKRNQKNILNEILNNHIILFGCENFYRLLKDARQ